jgi:hypothetical protein
MLKNFIKKNKSLPSVYWYNPKLTHNIYDLNYATNVYHVDEWELTKDFVNLCLTNNLAKTKKFHDSFVVNYHDFLKDRSLEKYCLCFYDLGWKQNLEIDYDVYSRFMNYNYRTYCDKSITADKNMIEWFNSSYKIESIHHHYAFNTAMLCNKIELVKILHEIRPIDFTRGFRWESDRKKPIISIQDVDNLKNKEMQNLVKKLMGKR